MINSWILVGGCVAAMFISVVATLKVLAYLGVLF